MKKLIVTLASIAALSILGVQKTVAESAAGAEARYCRPPLVNSSDPNGKAYWELAVRKRDPNFVLDYFQDPDEHGVSLTVTIRAMPLVAIYFKWEDTCQPSDTPQPGRKPCANHGKTTPGYRYAYWTESCVAQPPEETYRSIEPRTISIWLEPSTETRGVLGKGPLVDGTQKPVLRYLYPDQWTDAAVQSGDWQILEKPSGMRGTDAENVPQERRAFFVLDPGVTDEEMPSRLPKIQSPATGWDGLLLFGLENKCRVNLAAVKGRDVCGYSLTEKIPGYGVSRFTATMKRMPLDVPGKWYIGVSFYQRAAIFDGGKGVEPVEARSFMFTDEMEEKGFSFDSYIIRSAPCNPDEPGNCWDDG
jgi:hypothetical protein